mmetsp:Transcript_6800/g.5950  ORF Transcript_6800/g.5950 Transcript_6800/m.5950 type:complete len:99 (+) Transcript_6800:769-1065(+)
MYCLLNSKQFPKYVKMLSNFSGDQYDRYKALLNKFIKACGIHQDEMRSKLKDNLAAKKIMDKANFKKGQENMPKEEGKDQDLDSDKDLLSIEEESSTY